TSSQFTVTVIDDEAPVISNVPDRVLVNTINNECDAVAEWNEPTAQDNCELVSFTSSHTSGEVFPTGDTTVLLAALDAAGNLTEIEFLVTVTDSQIPSIVGLATDFTVVTEPGICGASVSWDLPFAVDNCGIASLTSNIPSGTFMSPGITTVSYTAADVNGNILISNFDVTVVDLESPQLVNLPVDVQLLSDPGLCDVAVEWAEVTATDNCGVESIDSTNTSGDRFSLGTTDVLFSATDIHGNVTTHTLVITVTDEEPPSFTSVPVNMIVENDLAVCGAHVSWEEPMALDNCTIASLVSDHISGDLFEIGDTSVTYVATDSSGNSVDTSFTVTVLDTEAPEIVGLPEVIEASTDAGECTGTIEWDLPSFTDNCLVVNTMSTHDPGDVFPIGDTVVTYSASDSADLITTVAFLITVSDQEQPQINGLPSDLVVPNDTGACGADVSWISPSAVDNCGVSNLTSDIENSSFFALGTTTVTYTATDVHGNSIEASFDVTVEDLELPQLSGLPSSIQIGSNSDLCGATATWAAPEAVDNCEVAEITQTHASGDFFPVGVTTVSYLVTDVTGNETTVSFEVQVADAQGPVVTGLPGVIEVENTTAQCGTEVTWEEPT
ncbi:MAG: HYR domain-containing protein, partial [Planctomycetes bacterium]|nr:HYR domain-containing protein [Planctomycetota bacterium]